MTVSGGRPGGGQIRPGNRALWREGDNGCGPGAERALKHQLALMQLHDPLCRGETEPAKDLDLSPSRGELYRVADQVEENLAGLALVGPQHRQVRREPDIDREPGLLDRWPADPDHRLDHLSQIEDL